MGGSQNSNFLMHRPFQKAGGIFFCFFVVFPLLVFASFLSLPLHASLLLFVKVVGLLDEREPLLVDLRQALWLTPYVETLQVMGIPAHRPREWLGLGLGLGWAGLGWRVKAHHTTLAAGYPTRAPSEARHHARLACPSRGVGPDGSPPLSSCPESPPQAPPAPARPRPAHTHTHTHERSLRGGGGGGGGGLKGKAGTSSASGSMCSEECLRSSCTLYLLISSVGPEGDERGCAAAVDWEEEEEEAAAFAAAGVLVIEVKRWCMLSESVLCGAPPPPAPAGCVGMWVIAQSEECVVLTFFFLSTLPKGKFHGTPTTFLHK